MPIAITTLNNNSAVAKTFTEIGKDMVSSAWINSTDSTLSDDIKLYIKQRLTGKAPNGSPIRQTLVQGVHTSPATVIAPNGNSISGVNEKWVVNLSITGPMTPSVLTETELVDLLAYVRNLVSGSVALQLRQGQV